MYYKNLDSNCAIQTQKILLHIRRNLFEYLRILITIDMKIYKRSIDIDNSYNKNNIHLSTTINTCSCVNLFDH